MNKTKYFLPKSINSWPYRSWTTNRTEKYTNVYRRCLLISKFTRRILS